MSGDLRASAASLPAGVREALSRALRERDAVRVAALPREAMRAGSRWGLAASALVLVGLWGALLARGYGQPASPALPWSELPVHVALASGAAGAAVLALRQRRRARGAGKAGPLAAGTYLFPRGVLVADGDELTVFPGDAAGPRVEVATTSERRELVVRRERGEVALRAEVAAGASTDGALLHLAARRESAGAAAFEAVVAHARRDGAPSPPERGGGAVRRVVPIVLAAGLLGASVLAARNAMSDAAALARAEGAGDAALLSAYARAGGSRAAEVERELLPRAEAARIAREGTVEELDRFLAAHPGTRAAEDARAARPAVLHRDFLGCTDMARLRSFVRAHPDAPEVPEARAKMHALYMEARHALRTPASGSDPDAAVVFDALLAWLEAHDDAPPIPVRFRRGIATSLARADAMLARGLLDDDGPARGGNAAASPHFDARHAERRERAVVLALEHALAKDLPPDVLHLALGAPLPPKPELGASPDQVPLLTRPSPPLHVSAPEVLVDYEVAWSGQSYVGREGGRRYVGVAFQFFVVLAVPGQDVTVDLATRVEPDATFAVDYTTWDPGLRAALPEAPAADAGLRPGLDDERVYEVMALRAFDQMATRFRERAFGAK